MKTERTLSLTDIKLLVEAHNSGLLFRDELNDIVESFNVRHLSKVRLSVTNGKVVYYVN